MNILPVGNRLLVIVALVILAHLVLTAAAQTPPATQPVPLPGAAGFVDLGRAIKAYLDEDRETAAEIFERLLEAYPTAEYRATCHYYLGLIALEHGLEHSSAAQAAVAQQERETAAQEADQAREQFLKAQTSFTQVVSVADPSVELVQAALLLGIAQLASDYPGGSQEMALDLARRAEDTLRRYVSETEPGATDRYGQFYLAVARYRLADAYRSQLIRSSDYVQNLRDASENLKRALELAAAERDAERLSLADYENFKTVITYYEGLLAILRRDNSVARTRFTEVTERTPGTDLAQNAQTIIGKLDEAEAAGPLPIQLPLPGPIGPLEVEGRIRIGNWYDTNVILLGKDTTLPRGYQRQDDYRFELSADINVSRYISKSEAPWVGESLTLGVGGGTSNGWQPNIPQFDVNRYPGRAYVNWQPVPDLYLGLQYEYSYTMLGHEPFISSHRVTPVISKTWRSTDGKDTDLGHTDFYYSHDDRDYQDKITDFRLNRDGVYQSAGVQHTFHLVQARDLPYMTEYFARHERERQLFGEDWLQFYIGGEGRDERTVGTEFDLAGGSLVWGLDVPLPYRLAFGLDGEFTWLQYTEPSIFDYSRKKRADFLQRYNFGLTYTFVARGEVKSMRTLSVKLRTGIELTFQNSNIWDRLGEDIYEYNRAIYGAQLEIGF